MVKNGCIQLKEINMDYVAFGRGEYPLIMLPGLGDGLRTVKGMALTMALTYRKLGKHFRVYVFSRRNDLPSGYSTRDMAADQAAAMEALDIQQAHILGVSQGGMIAQHLAADYPEKVNKLVLTVSTAQCSADTREILKNWIALMQAGNYGEIMVDTAERSYSESYLKKYGFMYPLLRRMGKPKNPERFIIQAKSCMEHNALDALADLRSPTLIIGGDHDKIVGYNAASKLHEAIPGSELFIYNRLGHGAYEEAKDFQEQVLSFLTK